MPATVGARRSWGTGREDAPWDYEVNGVVAAR
jgi:hypothetical protein